MLMQCAEFILLTESSADLCVSLMEGPILLTHYLMPDVQHSHGLMCSTDGK